MTDIDQLLGRMAEPVFDREALLREVLFTKVMEWLNGAHFYINDLTKMRGIAHDILGLPSGRQREFLSPDIERLHCMPFGSLSPVNLRECVVSALEYVGITGKTGVDLLGVDGWTAVERRVEGLGDVNEERACSQPGRSSEITAWSQLALAELFISIFKGKKFFSICEVDRLHLALNQVRDTLGIARHESDPITMAALNALHCQHYDKMSEAVRDGLIPAVWEACGLSETVGISVFGDQWERIKAVAIDIDPGRVPDDEHTTAHQALETMPRVGRRSPHVLPLVTIAFLIAGLLGISVLSFSVGEAKGRRLVAPPPPAPEIGLREPPKSTQRE